MQSRRSGQLNLIPQNLVSLITESHDASRIAARLRELEQRDPSPPVLPLFPEYTDHGFAHLRAVLSLAEFLIADGTHQRPRSIVHLTPDDAVVLTDAVLLHDIGMHLCVDGLLALIAGALDGARITELDNNTWLELWTEFLEEATRWDDRTRTRLFGTAGEGSGINSPRIRRPPSNSQAWTELDRRLAGEFLRRHHPRFAHEIASRPATCDTASLRLDPHLLPPADCSPLADLAGVVARSHGCSIRALFPYLKERHFNLVETRGVHAVYLMTLLRVADFLHLHAERAPGGKAAIQRLHSPISKREWAAHQAIHDIRLDTDPDPEAVVIDINPERTENVSTYFRLKDWIKGLQAELDHSWAILGEVYGRHPVLSQLWLTVRRVKSNLDSPALTKRLRFIPTYAAFETANGDFLKLLCRPLYGDNPSVGVRELMQNAIDAVRERREIIRQAGGERATAAWSPLDPRFVDSDVLVSRCRREPDTPRFQDGGPPDHWTTWVEVSDRGVGMTPELVRDYFLKAGATYRRSSAWLRTFVNDAGKAGVLRSGRFGIGVLAAFLIGDEIQVQSRHYASELGTTFHARLDDEMVEQTKCSRDVGTTIRVIWNPGQEDSQFSARYDWDWYYLEDPKVTLYTDGDDIRADRRVDDEEDADPERLAEWNSILPAENVALPPTWRRISDDRFSDVQWTYHDSGIPKLSCNGLRIQDGRGEIRWHVSDGQREWSSSSRFETYRGLELPSISVFDPDGNFPLKLARDGLATSSLPFSEQLLRGVIRDLLAYALVMGPRARLSQSTHSSYRTNRYPGHGEGRLKASQWVSLRDGFTLAELGLLQWAGVRTCLALVARPRARDFALPLLDERTGAIAFSNSLGSPRYPDFEWPLSPHRPHAQVPEKENPLAPTKAWEGCRILLSKAIAKSLSEGRVSFDNDSTSEDEPRHLWGRDSIRKLEGDRFLLIESSGKIPPLDESHLPQMARALTKRSQSQEAGVVAEWYLKTGLQPSEENLVEALWRRIIRQPSIPYSLEERQAQLAHAFQELETEVRCWTSVLESRAHSKAGKKAAAARGAFPMFTHSNQIKAYLRANGVTQKVYSKKVYSWEPDRSPSFVVYASYTRDELTRINPVVPLTGNPFKVEIDHALLPGLKKIEQLLKGSNAYLAGPSSPMEDE